jgi:hypothetical protein
MAGTHAINPESSAPTGVQIGPYIHAGTPHLPQSRPVAHTKERCKGCGLWVRKDGACELCDKSTVRAQAELAQSLPQRRSAGPSMLRRHAMEKCSSCGLWKAKTRGCDHCMQLETTKQAARGIMRKSLSAALRSGRSFSIAGTHAINPESSAPTGVQIGPYIHAGTPHLPQSRPVAHTKERCKGCGLWVPKDGACELCDKSTVRAQAESQLKRRPLLRPHSASGMTLGSPLRNAVETHTWRVMERSALKQWSTMSMTLPVGGPGAKGVMMR